MWVMQQLERRSGALDVDLISNQPGEVTLLSSSAQGLDEREYGQCSRAAPLRLTLISLLSTGEARGANSILRVYWICVKNVAATVCASTTLSYAVTCR